MMITRIAMYVTLSVVGACLGHVAHAEMKVEFAKQPANVANVVNGQTLSGKDLKAAQEMSDIYAKQVFLSECYESNKHFLMLDTKTKKSKMTAEQLTKSCGCMADKIIKASSATDLIGYMSSVHGAMPQGKALSSKELGFSKDDPMPYKKGDKTPNKFTNYKNNSDPTTYSKIAAMNSNESEQKKCGLTP